jgi:hypothetical protein
MTGMTSTSRYEGGRTSDTATSNNSGLRALTASEFDTEIARPTSRQVCHKCEGVKTRRYAGGRTSETVTGVSGRAGRTGDDKQMWRTYKRTSNMDNRGLEGTDIVRMHP